jgi:hypothetical protein
VGRQLHRLAISRSKKLGPKDAPEHRAKTEINAIGPAPDRSAKFCYENLIAVHAKVFLNMRRRQQKQTPLAIAANRMCRAKEAVRANPFKSGSRMHYREVLARTFGLSATA